MRIRAVPLLVLALILGSGAVIAAPTTADAAQPNCSLFTARVYDQLNPGDRRSDHERAGGPRRDELRRRIHGEQGLHPDRVTPLGNLVARVHKLYRAAALDYLYTYDSAEIKNAVNNYGYKDMGVAFFAATKPHPACFPSRSFATASTASSRRPPNGTR